MTFSHSSESQRFDANDAGSTPGAGIGVTTLLLDQAVFCLRRQVVHMHRRVYGAGLSLHERPEFHHEDMIRLLSLESARVAEDEALSALDNHELQQELQGETTSHKQLRGKTESDLLEELAAGMRKLEASQASAKIPKAAKPSNGKKK